MIKSFALAMVLCSFAGCFSSFAQESVVSDSLFNNRDRGAMPLLPDSIRLQNQPLIPIPPLEMQEMESIFKQRPVINHFELNDITKEPSLFLPPRFKPQLNFNMGASRWEMPMIGGITTFSPTLNYQLTKDLGFFGGVSLSQYHNLSYVQSIVAPNWPAKSNIIANGFVGATYRLHERVILHGVYQRSIYNQLPSNIMMLAPGQNMIVTGASLDVWNGLGVTVDHVWEFDRYGNMRKGFRYSPYIDLPKFIKFLRQ